MPGRVQSLAPSEATPDALDITVIVATYDGAARIATCLASLVDQTLAPERFEILVVQNGPACDTPRVVRSVRELHPRHNIRLITTSEPGAAAARNLGIHAARGNYLTIVDDDDWVGRRFLEALVAAARPGVVPTALICDVAETEQPGSINGSLDNYVSNLLAPFVGRTLPATDLSAAMSLHAGKLLPAGAVRRAPYRADLRSGEDFVFLIGLYAQLPFSFHIVVPDADSLYYRQVRENSVSRQPDGYDFLVSQRLACVAALGEIAARSEATQTLIRNASGGQGGFARRHLTAHPEDQERAVREAAERGVDSREFWLNANKDRARDLALLYLFPPFQDTSALVAARRLRERGLVTDVISQYAGNIRQREPSTTRVAEEFIGRQAVLPGGAYFQSWAAARTYAESSVGQAMVWQETQGPYRSVYTRAMAPASHFAGALMKARNPDIHWLAEFSDPLVHDAYGDRRHGSLERDEFLIELADAMRKAGFAVPDHDEYFEWAEILPYALADEIVFTNENQRQFMLSHTEDRSLAERAGRISTVSHHPTLPPAFYAMETPEYELDPDCVHIGYFGAFYLTRGLTEVVEGVRRLAYSERSRLRIHVFTAHPADLKREAIEGGMSDVLLPHPYLAFLDFLAITKRFDALIVNDAATSHVHELNPYLPSKLSDYLGSGTDIWSVVEPGSVLSTVPTAWSSVIGDADGAARVMTSLVRARFPMSEPALSPFHMTGSLDA